MVIVTGNRIRNTGTRKGSPYELNDAVNMVGHDDELIQLSMQMVMNL
ncbi:hypothetical protein [Desulfobacter hydrogenophilus]|nr:hypothetical protein [Desulfobacter hydrogenophilus]NDY72255.1 hypothetical protein [Desulfobacter hydrogenophilus]